jgi:hypothetical protein
MNNYLDNANECQRAGSFRAKLGIDSGIRCLTLNEAIVIQRGNGALVAEVVSFFTPSARIRGK